MNLQSAATVPPAELHAAFAAAFSDYLAGPFSLALDRWPEFLARQTVDLTASRVVRLDGAMAAFALVAPRPELGRWRLAAMGAVPAARRHGAAARLLDDLAARAAAAGVALELEAFAQNEPALRLYRSRGFVERHPLRAYARRLPEADATLPPPPARAVTLADAIAWLRRAATDLGDLPLQVTGAPLAPAPAPFECLQSVDGSAQLVFHRAAGGDLIVDSLVDRDPAQPGAAALLRALSAREAGSHAKVPPLQRPDLGGDALASAGWQVQPLFQWLMVRAAIPAG